MDQSGELSNGYSCERPVHSRDDGAGELIAPLPLAVQAGMNRATLRSGILPHPGYSEVFQGLFRS
jgi:pyruvate/2-oxoglutarate dehydrogenase complex dihydrolipoamide dehydrogenase (E3) component